MENKMGNRIKQLRLQAQMTQEEIGKIIDVNKAAIQKYESGHVTNIKRRKISALCRFFNISPTWLMGFDEDFEKESELNRKATKETRVIDGCCRHIRKCCTRFSVAAESFG